MSASDLDLTPAIVEQPSTVQVKSERGERLLLAPVAGGAPTLDVVHHCDALTLLRALPSESIDLVVTSPPYNMRTATNGAKLCGQHTNNWSGGRLLTEGYSGHQDNLPHEEYVSWQRNILAECFRVIKETGAIFYNHKWRIQNGLLDMHQDIMTGLPVRQVIIWDRGSGMNHNRAFFMQTYEVVYLIAKRYFYLNQDKASAFGDVWQIPPEANSSHPAPFPVAVAERCIASTTAKIILDPFMGSGTTALAAQRLKRHYIGCDISAEYVKQARERLAPYQDRHVAPNTVQMSLFAAVMP